jgi:LmeA-like phospholipid-binding
MGRGVGVTGWRRLLLWGTGGILLLLVLAQLILPRIAASVVSSKVGRYGKVLSVSLSAWPAVKLLWGDVDSVKVKAGALHIEPAQAGKLLWEARSTARMEVSAESVQVGSLRVTHAQLTKRGSALTATAQATEAAVNAALPSGFSVQLLKSEGGAVEVQASGGLFGIGASVDAVGEASEGKLVAHPLGLLIEGFRLTLYSDPHVYVEGVGASRLSSQPLTYGLSMRASLR